MTSRKRGSFGGSEQLDEGRGGIVGEHQVLTDEEAVEARAAKVLKVGVGAESGFGDGETTVGNVLDELERGLHADGQGFQVAVVDADDAGSSGKSAVQFHLCVDLDERLHREFAAKNDEIVKKRVVERRDDEKEAVGIVCTGFPDLPGT